MQVFAPTGTPRWISARRFFERILSDLHNCKELTRLKQVLAIVFKSSLHRDNVIGTKLISAFAHCRQMDSAVYIFDHIETPDVLAYNVMIKAHLGNSQPLQAFGIFSKMQNSGVRPNIFTCPFLLKANFGAGDMERARCLFDKMPVKNMVAWTILISAYVEKGFAKEAMGLYDQMAATDVKPDEGAITSILGACAESGMLGLGNRVHDFVKTSRYNCSMRVSNALINMYVKCGRLDDALNVFRGMKEKNSVTWSTMIHGLGIHGYGEQALQLFSRMIQKGFAPNKVTFIGLMCACSHAGLVDDGIHYFDAMQRDYGLNPEIAHYGCMIDLLGRGGRLKEAFRLVLSMPMKPNEVIWGALLAACRKHDAVTIGEEELQQLVQQGLTDDGNLSILSDIYAAAGDWSGMANARLYMKNTCREKKPSGTSSIELENEYHHFTMMDVRHPKSDLIYQILGALSQHMRKAGTTEIVPSIGARVPTIAGRKLPKHQYKKVGSPFSISCCQLGSKSPSPEDENRTLVNADWRSFRARLVAGEKAFRPVEATPVVDLDTAVDQPPLITIGDKWAHILHEPEKGCLLIATEKLDGVHIFERTVILLLATGPVGPVGIILNRPSLMSIKEMRSSSALDAVGTFSDRPLFFGGPLEEGFFLVSPESGNEGVGKSGVFEEVMKGLYCGTKSVVGCAAEMVKRNVVEAGDFSFFDGYCAWEKEQLREEIRSGYWTVAACSPSVVGLASAGSVGLWEEILGLMGPKRVW
ncbi:OLC1v1009665C2 [Oldenlandia corymbosa var. corymbosa]|uniref:OLC1v1009665C2 n=1 Tax=Oldenlandia corymbosa var. corymbosa TaxID=529605 RepID=A0AAV1DSG1_OLDCO|nr:OLC1v1009665C2 [Oldenlandia corymbosa var. corymbosa]